MDAKAELKSHQKVKMFDNAEGTSILQGNTLVTIGAPISSV